LIFQQTAAPTGWTKQTTHDNKALRVVSGTASSGGSTAFTSVFTSRTPGGSISGTVQQFTLSTAQIPSHTHQYQRTYDDGAAQPGQVTLGGNNDGGYQFTATGSAGSDQAHSHGFTGSFSGSSQDFAVQYVDVIIATKD